MAAICRSGRTVEGVPGSGHIESADRRISDDYVVAGARRPAPEIGIELSRALWLFGRWDRTGERDEETCVRAYTAVYTVHTVYS